MPENHSRAISPGAHEQASASGSEPADAATTSTMIQYDRQQYDGFGAQHSNQQNATDVGMGDGPL